jgi:L-arabinokinase
MDQIASNCGAENKLISILCQPAEIREVIEIPKELEFWGIDSGVRHAVAGSDYASVRIGAFMGYRIIAGLAGLKCRPAGDAFVTIDDDRWHGYLSNVSPDEYDRSFASALPGTISGADFIAKYSGITDNVTKIDQEKTYIVKAPTEHAIYENFRVQAFAEELKRSDEKPDPAVLGQLMFRSHASYAACGLNEPGTGRIVELVRKNHTKGLFGARITGGGSGGTVAILSLRDNAAAIAAVAEEYEKETGRKAYIFHGSSPGSASFGHLKLEKMPD